MTRRVTTAVFLVVSCGACNLISPEDELVTRVSVFPSVISVGEQVRLTVITTNSGSRTVQTMGCGPGLGYEVTLPDGSRLQPLEGLAYVCPLYDSNVLEPAETDTLVFEWQPPTVRGTYLVRGGVRLGRLEALSPPRSFELR